jgi:REP element-mobilizing transposase RayT
MVYHVVARGNEKKPIFRDDEDRHLYLRRLSSCRRRFGFALYAYCLMENHVHLVLERGPARLSRVMLNLHSFYAQQFNERHERVGHLFQGRYKAILVDKQRYLLAVVRYVHENPTRAGIVGRPEDYRWSSARAVWKGTGPEWLDLGRLFAFLGGSFENALARYRTLMRGDGIPIVEEPPKETAFQGSADFVGPLVAGNRAGATAPIRLAPGRIVKVVASDLGIRLSDVRGPGQRPSPSRARGLAAYLAVRECGLTHEAMAAYFRRDASTVTKSVRRIESAVARDPALRRKILSLSRRLKGIPVLESSGVQD